MPDIQADVIGPSQFVPTGNADPFPVERYAQRYLAQGDSWFSLGAALALSTTNLLLDAKLSRATLVVDCAQPGSTLSRMTDTTTNTRFLDLVADPRKRWPWDALLLSGGGNDLIEAAGAKPTAPQALRLFLAKREWGTQAGPARYVSEAGWTTFDTHLRAVLGVLLQQCERAVHPDMPLVLHTYDYVTPRDAPAGPGIGPWLSKAMAAYGIPTADWNALSDHLIDRLAGLLLGFAAGGAARPVQVVDTRGTLQRAATGSTGADGGWLNEIHPTARGYAQLQARWRPVLDALPRLDPV